MSIRSLVLLAASTLSIAAAACSSSDAEDPRGTLAITVLATSDGAREALIGSSVSITSLDGASRTRLVLSHEDAARTKTISVPAGLHEIRWEIDTLNELDAELAIVESEPRLVTISGGTQSSIVLRPAPVVAARETSTSSTRLALH